MDPFIFLFTMVPTIALIALWKQNDEFMKENARARARAQVSATATAAVALETQIRLVEMERVTAA